MKYLMNRKFFKLFIWKKAAVARKKKQSGVSVYEEEKEQRNSINEC